METFSALLAICAGNSPVPGEFPAQRPVTQSFDVFFDLHPGKRLSKQWCGWWFEKPSCPLWRHRNGWEAKLTKHPWVAGKWATSTGFMMSNDLSHKSGHLVDIQQQKFAHLTLDLFTSKWCATHYFLMGSVFNPGLTKRGSFLTPSLEIWGSFGKSGGQKII